MEEEIHASVVSIQNMEAACARFGQVVLEHLPEIESQLQQVTENLEEHRTTLRKEISRLSEQIASAADDEDTGWLHSRLEEAQEEMVTVRRRISQVSEGIAAYRAQARRVEDLASGHTAQARDFLESAADDLKAYFNKTLDASRVGTSASSAAPANLVAVVGAAEDSKHSNLRNPASFGSILLPVEGDLSAFRSQQGPLALEAKTREYEQRTREYPELARLSVEEYLAVNRYTQFDYENINRALRCNEVSDLQTWGPQIRLSLSGLKKLPVYEGTVFRGAASDAFADTYVPGAIVTERGFTSTTSDTGAMSNRSEVQFEIISKTGRDIKSCSAMQSELAREKEVLFAPNTQFAVTARIERNGATLIKLEEV